MNVGNVEDLGLEQRLLPLERVLAADHHDLELVVLKSKQEEIVPCFFLAESNPYDDTDLLPNACLIGRCY